MADNYELASNDGSGGALALASRPAVFMRPTYTGISAWHEHVPFAFWLVDAHRPKCIVELGSHYGVSYFAFCQAVQTLAIDTRCYAVDTWKGDDHAGFYDEEVYRTVSVHNNAHYSGFSRLVRSTFDAAMGHFSDGQIDILHIDGHHTFESVQHDFATWLPKLSDRAIVILHDTNVRERGFGVFKLFEELKAKYPHFEFLHGHGLGVVGVGANQVDSVKALLSLQNDERGRRDFMEFFALLGRGCADSFLASKREKELVEAQKSEADARAEADSIAKDVNSLQAELNHTKQSLEAESRQAQLLNEEVSKLRGELHKSLEAESRQAQLLNEEVSKLRGELHKSLEAESRQAQLLNEEVSKLRGELQESRKALEAEKERGRQDKAQLEKNIAMRFDEITTLTRMVKEGEKVAERAEKLRHAAALEIGRITSALLGESRFPLPRKWRAKQQSRRIQRLGLFDAGWYLRENKDVAEAGVNPGRHYVDYGAKEGREPNSALADAFSGTPSVKKADE